MNIRIACVSILIFTLLVGIIGLFPQAYMSKFTEGGMGGKIVVSETGKKVFEITVEDQKFHVTVLGEGITALVFNKDERMLVLENDGTGGMLEVEIPRGLLGGEFTVFVDDSKKEFNRSENETNSILLLDRSNGSKLVTIHGTTVVPEFPYIVTLSLAGALALLIITISIKRFSTRSW